MKTFVKSGQMMPFTPGADVESGALVQVGTIVGAATGKILSGAEGELLTVGVVEVPNPDSVPFAQGALVGYLTATNKVVAAGGGDFDCGTAHRVAPASTAPVQVLLPLGPGAGNGM